MKKIINQTKTKAGFVQRYLLWVPVIAATVAFAYRANAFGYLQACVPLTSDTCPALFLCTGTCTKTTNPNGQCSATGTGLYCLKGGVPGIITGTVWTGGTCFGTVFCGCAVTGAGTPTPMVPYCF